MKKRVALLISGYLRSFKLNIPSLQDKILSKFDQVDVYLHLTDDESHDDRYLNLNDLEKDMKYINDVLRPTVILREHNAKYSEDLKFNNLMNSWVKYYKLFQSVEINQRFGNFEYDLVIKYRPDLNLISDNLFVEDMDPGVICIPADSKVDKFKLRKETDGHVCDIFAYGDAAAMRDYFNIVVQLRNIYELLHVIVPETVLHFYLITFRIPYKLVDIEYSVILSSCNVFAIAGDSGSGKSTLGKLLKERFNNSFMLEGDRYHKWERGDENWKSHTHLNPEANYIAKMNKDVFNLKIGQSVYQVDYDHSNGKFTKEEEKIDQAENLIVCGLHGFYSDNDHVYDLKIFMDTDEKLKLKWKIERDVKERGHPLEKVIQQVESRKDDYKNFVEPQKEKSDVIVQFYENDDALKLRVFIRRTLDCFTVESRLKREYHIPFRLSFENKDFWVFEFDEYVINEKFLEENKLGNRNFYDYIVFLILNLNEK